MNIEYDENDYEVIEVEKINDVELRIIKYNTGYYALQSSDYNENYRTWLISPNKQYTNAEYYVDEDTGERVPYGFKSLIGLADIKTVCTFVKDAEKLYNGEYWELSVMLEGTGEVIYEKIKKSDGEKVVALIESLSEAQSDTGELTVDEYYWGLTIIFLIIGFIVLGVIIWLHPII